MLSKKAIRIVAFALAFLMAIGVLAVILNVI